MSKFTVIKLGSDESVSEPVIKPVKDIDTGGLSFEQEIAFNKFVKGENIFVTGPGGTGKTKLVQNLIDYANSIERPGQVCAMTGCAAVLIGCKARTIHSWSGIKLAKGPKDRIISAVLKNRNAVKEWKAAKFLVLDEVSMLSQKIFEILEELGRRIRKNPAVFGGLQVVFLGDFFQLPPIETENDPGSEKFCFESPVWNRVFPIENHIELTKIFRQNDPIYIDILMQIRRGHLEKDKIELLETYVNREYDPEQHNGCVPTKLFAIRSKVDLINKQMFSKIAEKEYVSDVIIKTDFTTYIESGKAIQPEILQKCNAMIAEQKDYEVENLLNNSTCSRLFRFKKGASVMCTVNLDMDNQICNGAQGIIIDILEDGLFPIIVVKFSNGIIKRIIHHFWQSEEYPAIAVGQYPLILAWALTIHKIQGATMKLAEIDIGTSIFEYGQTYVALSRIQSLDGLYLSAFQPQKIRANPVVTEFYNSIKT
jgi:ATP-dependent DNA helicase PIF1